MDVSYDDPARRSAARRSDEAPRIPPRSWPFVLLRSLLALLLGVLTLLVPAAALASIVLVFAAYMLVDGGFAIGTGVMAARAHRPWCWFSVQGLASIAMGVVALLWPAITVLSFMMIAAAWATLSGVAMLIGAVRVHDSHGRVWLVLGGIVALVWGIAMIIAPMAGALAITWWLGVYAFLFGSSMLIGGLHLRRAALAV